MKIIITAGGTSEPIDNVRKITNKSSGRLGIMIAQEFRKYLYDGDIIYFVCPNDVITISNKHTEIIRVTDVQSVYDTLEKLVPECDIIIHAMAVSDYKVQYVTTTNSIAITLGGNNMDDILDCLNKGCIKTLDISDKLSSSEDDLMIKLTKTPKIIDKIKEWNPNIKLVGFKLLSGVSNRELFKVGFNQLERCHCDIVVANDITKIDAESHEALILDSKTFKRVKTKEEIAHELARRLLANVHK